MTDGCLCWGSRSELGKEVWWLSDEACPNRKTLIPKLQVFQWGQKCIAAKGRKTDGQNKPKTSVGHSWVHVCIGWVAQGVMWRLRALWWSVTKQEELASETLLISVGNTEHQKNETMSASFQKAVLFRQMTNKLKLVYGQYLENCRRKNMAKTVALSSTIDTIDNRLLSGLQATAIVFPQATRTCAASLISLGVRVTSESGCKVCPIFSDHVPQSFIISLELVA